MVAEFFFTVGARFPSHSSEAHLGATAAPEAPPRQLALFLISVVARP
jgi:hypothetical protein